MCGLGCLGLSSPLDDRGVTVAATTAPSPRALDEGDLVARLRDGDDRAFESLVSAYHSGLIAVALTYVRTREVAEEVVQETWLGVLHAIGRFEGRASLKTWITRILVNTAITRARREARSVPLSSLESVSGDGPAVDPDRFRPPGDAYPGHWRSLPADWTALPEEELLGRETLGVVQRAIDVLPAAQRRVITMRDVVGFDSDDVCAALDLSPGNQRVLLHRARSRVRAALEEHLDE
jgi:RNA polymerase sigma-70 factor (ECF subfamily)